MPRLALGLIETVGLAAAVEAADAAVKAANITLIGYELTRGGGLVTVKLQGDVGAVKAAVEAGCEAAGKVNRVWSKQIIPRPHEELDKLVCSRDTIGAAPPQEITEKYEAPEQQEAAMKTAAEENVEENRNEESEADEDGEPENSLRDYCNICFDPLCPRRKGELRSNCIHYGEEKEVL